MLEESRLEGAESDPTVPHTGPGATHWGGVCCKARVTGSQGHRSRWGRSRWEGGPGLGGSTGPRGCREILESASPRAGQREGYSPP